MALKILILEDDQNRINTFQAGLAQHDLTIVIDAIGAIQALQEKVFDIIFLDHDLGGNTFIDESDKNTGSEVVRWMCEKMDLAVPVHVIIHSLNEPAAESMFNKLEDIGMMCQRIPFTQLVSLFKDPNFIRES